MRLISCPVTCFFIRAIHSQLENKLHQHRSREQGPAGFRTPRRGKPFDSPRKLAYRRRDEKVEQISRKGLRHGDTGEVQLRFSGKSTKIPEAPEVSGETGGSRFGRSFAFVHISQNA
jgi:hypothetical protein